MARPTDTTILLKLIRTAGATAAAEGIRLETAMDRTRDEICEQLQEIPEIPALITRLHAEGSRIIAKVRVRMGRHVPTTADLTRAVRAAIEGKQMARQLRASLTDPEAA